MTPLVNGALKIATHVLCDCEAIALLRFRHLGQFLWYQVTVMTPP
jgi:hypothetical protein